MRIVLDTNVLVSALLHPHGPSANVLRLVLAGTVTLVADERILLEYDEVVHRPHLGIAAHALDDILSVLRDEAEMVTATVMVANLPDQDDGAFIEVVLTARADILVTGNKKHFPAAACRGILICSPVEFMERIARDRQ